VTLSGDLLDGLVLCQQTRELVHVFSEAWTDISTVHLDESCWRPQSQPQAQLQPQSQPQTQSQLHPSAGSTDASSPPELRFRLVWRSESKAKTDRENRSDDRGLGKSISIASADAAVKMSDSSIIDRRVWEVKPLSLLLPLFGLGADSRQVSNSLKGVFNSAEALGTLLNLRNAIVESGQPSVTHVFTVLCWNVRCSLDSLVHRRALCLKVRYHSASVIATQYFHHHHSSTTLTTHPPHLPPLHSRPPSLHLCC
jgi:hypothetical protein